MVELGFKPNCCVVNTFPQILIPDLTIFYSNACKYTKKMSLNECSLSFACQYSLAKNKNGALLNTQIVNVMLYKKCIKFKLI